MQKQTIAAAMIILAFALMYRGAAAQHETHKEIRNEIQALTLAITERIECVPLVWEGKTEVKVTGKKQAKESK